MEDVREFFETADEAAAAEARLEAATRRAAAASAARGAASLGSGSQPASAAKQLDPGAIQWQNEWS